MPLFEGQCSEIGSGGRERGVICRAGNRTGDVAVVWYMSEPLGYQGAPV